MATTRDRVKVSFTDDERAQVDALAKQLHLSISELLRRLVLGHRLPDASDFVAAEAIRDLLKINADQARLGNLLKLLIDEADGSLDAATLAQVRNLLEAIYGVQADLRDSVKALHHRIHPRAAQ